MRVAVFVDAGYLYAQASVAVAGSILPRTEVELDLSGTIAKLVETSITKAEGASLLRIYWYDGLLFGRLSADQERLADKDNVKLRLGVVNQRGQQKGVDSLIVTDLVELARNQAISDAVMLTGDEDLRIAVQIAQSLGVRVHLVGIEPKLGSQSVSLLQEADTTTEWSKADMRALLALKPGLHAHVAPTSDLTLPDTIDDTAHGLTQAVDRYVSTLNPKQLKHIDGLEETDDIPHEFDGRLLPACGASIGRYLDSAEKDQVRTKFRQAVRNRVKNL